MDAISEPALMVDGGGGVDDAREAKLGLDADDRMRKDLRTRAQRRVRADVGARMHRGDRTKAIRLEVTLDPNARCAVLAANRHEASDVFAIPHASNPVLEPCTTFVERDVQERRPQARCVIE